MANSVDPDQTAPIGGAVCSGSVLFASILNLSVMLGNYLQQTTSADIIFQMHFSRGFKSLVYGPVHKTIDFNKKFKIYVYHNVMQRSCLKICSDAKLNIISNIKCLSLITVFLLLFQPYLKQCKSRSAGF